ncbi:hypothetical protein UVI_02008930 [Ustilaginoidea virens]|uniref:Core domain-containing protein n=1 Tax=Ustilaginoidea virens TaxID=1159556 RepID=A0A1B5KUK4_USTVR|nr:hypothetical protein UVI_02008930 [Ustilaginoidea virens]
MADISCATGASAARLFIHLAKRGYSSDSSAARLSDIMNKDKNPNLALRIQVESGGCHGFQYLMNDTIFQFSPDGEPASPAAEGAKVILDEPSLELLKGSKVDFTMELIGSQFKIVDNPYAKSSCGCGTSFDVKM